MRHGVGTETVRQSKNSASGYAYHSRTSSQRDHVKPQESCLRLYWNGVYAGARSRVGAVFSTACGETV